MTTKQVGVEMEYPKLASEATHLVSRGRKTRSECRDLQDAGWSPPDGRLAWDGTVGIEAVSDPMRPSSASEWYREVMSQLEAENILYEPTGLINASTAGTHIHISKLSRGQARTLAQWSHEEWLQVFVGSSVVGGSSEDHRVFRGGDYCRMTDSITGSRYNVVNERSRINGHYEWRMPEPMLPDHFEVVMEFVDRFVDDPKDARSFAKSVLDDESSDVLTAVQRADAVGIGNPTEVKVLREPHPTTEGFYTAVRTASDMPYIKKVVIEGDAYYAFEGSADPPFDAQGVAFDTNTVFDATTLDRVFGQARARVLDVLDNGDEANTTPATELLKEVAAKKKSWD
jgi:hypothetical protein